MRRSSGLMPVLLLFSLPCFAQVSTPASTPVVISQVYGGAGCGTAGCSTYQNDFIELYNRSGHAVSLNGYSVQYGSAAGTGSFSVTNLPNVTLQPGQYYLIAEAFSANGVNPLPTPDFTFTTSISATAGRVALVTNNTTPFSGTGCPPSATIVDFIGFGSTASCFEGTGPAPAPSTTTADIRQASGTLDGNNNNLDFQALAPNPRNTGSSFGPILPLPVSFGAVTAVRNARSIAIHWDMLYDDNTGSFIIERSADGTVFTALGSIPSSGLPTAYSYTDNDPLGSVNYYRLKALKRTGGFLYSPVVIVKMQANSSIELYPNPAVKEIQVQFVSAGREKLQIMDANGRLVTTIMIGTVGPTTTTIDVSGLEKGLYFIWVGNQHVPFIKL